MGDQYLYATRYLVDQSLTILKDRNLFDGSAVAEEIEMHEGDILGTGVFNDSLDAGVTHAAQGDIQGGCLLDL